MPDLYESGFNATEVRLAIREGGLDGEAGFRMAMFADTQTNNAYRHAYATAAFHKAKAKLLADARVFRH